MNREDAKGFEDAMLLIECVLDTLIEMGNCVTDVKSYEVASDLFKVREILKKEQETGKLLRICSMTGEECSNRDDPENVSLCQRRFRSRFRGNQRRMKRQNLDMLVRTFVQDAVKTFQDTKWLNIVTIVGRNLTGRRKKDNGRANCNLLHDGGY